VAPVCRVRKNSLWAMMQAAANRAPTLKRRGRRMSHSSRMAANRFRTKMPYSAPTMNAVGAWPGVWMNDSHGGARKSRTVAPRTSNRTGSCRAPWGNRAGRIRQGIQTAASRPSAPTNRAASQKTVLAAIGPNAMKSGMPGRDKTCRKSSSATPRQALPSHRRLAGRFSGRALQTSPTMRAAATMDRVSSAMCNGRRWLRSLAAAGRLSVVTTTRITSSALTAPKAGRVSPRWAGWMVMDAARRTCSPM